MPSQDHLARLGDTDWRMWRDIALRSTGFPADQVLSLGDPALAAAADAAAANPDRLEAYRAEYRAAGPRLSAAIQTVARIPRFREAVAWQNPKLVSQCLDKAAAGEPRNVRGRNHELAIAGYLQRYCLKNDTIGFFGPVGWSRWADDGPPLAGAGGRAAADPADGLLRGLGDRCGGSHAERRSGRPALAGTAPAVGASAGRIHPAPAQPTARPGRRRGRAAAAVRRQPNGGRHRRRVDLVGIPGTGRARRAVHRLRPVGRARPAAVDLVGPIEALPERTLRTKLTRITDPAVRDPRCGRWTR